MGEGEKEKGREGKKDGGRERGREREGKGKKGKWLLTCASLNFSGIASSLLASAAAAAA